MIRETMMSVFNENVENESIKMINKSSDVDINTTRVYGTFLEWSLGGSENSKLATNSCIRNKPKFIAMYQQPSEYSNRAFTIEIGLSKDGIENDLDKVMGNELGLIET